MVDLIIRIYQWKF